MGRNHMDLRQCDLVAVLRALYDHALCQGLGRLHFRPGPLSREEAAELLRIGGDLAYFDYLMGRVMKVRISHKEPMRTDLYDRDMGEGAAARALAGVVGWKWCEETFDQG